MSASVNQRKSVLTTVSMLKVFFFLQFSARCSGATQFESPLNFANFIHIDAVTTIEIIGWKKDFITNSAWAENARSELKKGFVEQSKPLLPK